MMKLAIFMALIGLSVAQVPQWWKKYGPLSAGITYPEDGGWATIYSNSGFYAMHFLEANAGWGSLYQGSYANDADTRMESYGVQVWSYARYHIFARYSA